jgi:hypothetical protein
MSLLSGARRYPSRRSGSGAASPWRCDLSAQFDLALRHDFISYHFSSTFTQRDVGEGRADGFLRDQFHDLRESLCRSAVAGRPVLIPAQRRYRMLAWMYLFRSRCSGFGKGRFYYVAEAYPMLLAMGAVRGRTLAGGPCPRWAGARRGLFLRHCSPGRGYFVAGWVPLASSGPLRDFALSHNGDLREEIGWDELVKTVAGIRDSLPPDQQASLGITVANYGEQGAIEMLGRPTTCPPISTTNSAWLRGYPDPPPTTLIVLGLGKRGGRLDLHRLPSRRTQRQCGRREERREPGPSGHLRLRAAAPTLGRVLWKEHQDFG